MARYRLLDEAQSRAVCRFLQFMAANPDDADDRVANSALRQYWGRFFEGSYAWQEAAEMVSPPASEGSWVVRILRGLRRMATGHPEPRP